MQKDLRKKKCAVCTAKFHENVRFCRLSSAFDEFDTCSQFLAVETLLSFQSVAELPDEEKLSFLDIGVSEQLES